MNQFNDTIIATATPVGIGALAIVRLSGNDAFTLCNKVFYNKSSKQNLLEKNSHTIHFGTIQKDTIIIDEVLVSLFKNPNSYTGEDVVEISCHGSTYITQQILSLFLSLGARMADAGEFTLRAFLNGKLDLPQAEAVADLIASDSEMAHKMAMQQIRGGFSNDIKELRQQLINFASLIELELDFSEEDVEFAERTHLRKTVLIIQNHIKKLADSFAVGNVYKSGVAVAIVGKPNAGKSTLLNVLLNEERSIVSEIAGTTRDFIEDKITINGTSFRFIDTAGLRQATDIIEDIGVKITYKKMEEAAIILYLYDINTYSVNNIEQIKIELTKYKKPFLMLANKIDIASQNTTWYRNENTNIAISALTQTGIDKLKEKLTELASVKNSQETNTIVSNARHHQALLIATTYLEEVIKAMDNNLPGELLAQDIKGAISTLGIITGDITNDDLLGNIFSKFCIGK